jgi:sugar phosphate isomerase/epimerase
VYVACSTLCFARHSLEEALRIIRELEFNKFEAAIHEQGRQLKPSEVAADVHHAANRLRLGPGLVPTAFSVEIEADTDAEAVRHFQAVCRLARVTAVPLVTVRAAAAGTDPEAEAERLRGLVRLAGADGIQVSVATLSGTLTECPDAALALCRRVRGLGLTLDPSHFIAGPYQGKNYDHVYPYVRHVHLRDTGKGPDQFQVRVGQGEVEYGRIVSQLARYDYNRGLTVDIRETADMPYAMEPEVRKLKYLLESLV